MNYASQIVKPAEFLPPVNENLLIQGAQQDKANADKASSAITSQLDALNALPTVGGADEQIKQQAIKKLSDSVNGLALNDLSNTNIQAQIKSNINSIVSNPDFQNVIKRGAQDQQKMKKFAELTAKGEQLAPENMEYLKQKQDYLSRGVYLKEADLSGDIYANADYNKLFETAAEKVKATTGFDLNKGGYDVETESKGLASIKEMARQMIMNNPQAYGQLQRKTKDALANSDFQGNAYRESINLATHAQTLALQEQHLAQLAADKGDVVGQRTHIANFQKYSQEYQEHLQASKNPNATAQKSQEEKDFVEKFLDNNTQQYAYTSTKSKKANEYAIHAFDNNNRIAAHKLDKEADEYTAGALALGYDLNKPLSIDQKQKAAEKTASMKMEEYQEKKDIDLKAKEEFQKSKEAYSGGTPLSKLLNKHDIAFGNFIKPLNGGNLSANQQDVVDNVAEKYNQRIQEALGTSHTYGSNPAKIIKVKSDGHQVDIEFETPGWNKHEKMSVEDFTHLIAGEELKDQGIDIGDLNINKSTGSSAPKPKAY